MLCKRKSLQGLRPRRAHHDEDQQATQSFLDTSSTMILRQKLQVMLLLLLSFLAFASYHSGTGSVAWIQWVTAITMLVFLMVFDFAFTNESMFIFDPDADNWRRKCVSSRISSWKILLVRFAIRIADAVLLSCVLFIPSQDALQS